MNKKLLLTGALLGLLVSTAAEARIIIDPTISIGGPAPVYAAPAPVYAAPVYAGPYPVYYDRFHHHWHEHEHWDHGHYRH